MLKRLSKNALGPMGKKLEMFRANQGGNFAITTALALMMFIGGLAVATDISNAYAAKLRLQDTTDAIALLAVRDNLKSDRDLQNAAQAYIESKFTHGDGARVKIKSIKRQGNRVDVQAYNNIDTYFSIIFGRENLDVEAQSQAIYDNRGLDLALVLDTTGSMSGSKLASLKSSANSLIDELQRQKSDHIRMSVVPFSQYVNVGKFNRNKSWIDNPYGNGWTGCVGSRDNGMNLESAYSGSAFPAVNVTYCPNELQPLSASLNQARKTISLMKARGWTYMPAGLAWGYRTLDGSQPFKSSKPTSSAVNKTEKVLVLMTDGGNTRSVSNRTHDAVNINEANNYTETLCETIKRENIKVYTIAFQLSSDAASKKARSILQNCASEPQNFFDTKNAGELNSAFRQIGQALVQPRLTA